MPTFSRGRARPVMNLIVGVIMPLAMMLLRARLVQRLSPCRCSRSHRPDKNRRAHPDEYSAPKRSTSLQEAVVVGRMAAHLVTDGAIKYCGDTDHANRGEPQVLPILFLPARRSSEDVFDVVHQNLGVGGGRDVSPRRQCRSGTAGICPPGANVCSPDVYRQNSWLAKNQQGDLSSRKTQSRKF